MKAFLLGLILITAGISSSIRQLWLTAIFGVVAFFLIIVFVKLMKIQTAGKREGIG